jgi:hypothetical protein
MKRLTLTTAVLAILMAPAAFAQSTLNTTAPGASQETKPGQTNNNLQNPGSMHQTTTTTTQTQQPSTTPDSTTGTMNNDTSTAPSTDTTTTTGTTYNSTAPSTDTTTGTMNNTDTTGSYNGSTSTTTTSSKRLPKTASDLPMVAMAGLLALFAASALRFYSKRNA